MRTICCGIGRSLVEFEPRGHPPADDKDTLLRAVPRHVIAGLEIDIGQEGDI